MSNKRYNLQARQFSTESGEHQYESDNSESNAVKTYETSPKNFNLPPLPVMGRE